MSASSTAALSLLNKGRKEEKGKFHATAGDDEMTVGTSKAKSHGRAGANGRRGGTPPPRGNATSNTNMNEASASVPAPSSSPTSPSMLLSHTSPVASSSKLTLESAIPRETVAKPPLAPTTYPVPLPTTPTRRSNLPAKGKGKEQHIRTTPPQARQSIPSSIPPNPTHQTSPSTTVATTTTTAANECPSDAETEVADDSLSTAATEIAPFFPQIPRRLNLPPRRIPTPPLPEVKAVDFAYRPKPSLAGLPERPIDPKWVVPRVPLPPGCETTPTLPGVKERWIRQWEAKQDEPGGIYRTGRNRVDGKPNPLPAITAIVTKEGVRGYTSQGWVSPSMKKPPLEPEEDRRRKASGGRQRPPMKHAPLLRHWKLEAPEETVKREGKGRNDTTRGSATVRRSPAPIISQPVPRRPIPPQDVSLPLPTSQADNSISPGRKRRYAETELGTDGDGDNMHHKNTNLKDEPKSDNAADPMDVDTVPLTQTNTRAKAKAKLHNDAGSSVKPSVNTTYKRKGKANGHSPEAQPVDVSPPAPRYSLRSHRNGKGKS